MAIAMYAGDNDSYIPSINPNGLTVDPFTGTPFAGNLYLWWNGANYCGLGLLVGNYLPPAQANGMAPIMLYCPFLIDDIIKNGVPQMCTRYPYVGGLKNTPAFTLNGPRTRITDKPGLCIEYEYPAVHKNGNGNILYLDGHVKNRFPNKTMWYIQGLRTPAYEDF